MSKIAILAPNVKSGGTVNLLSHLAELIVRNGDILIIVDYEKGWVSAYLRDKGLVFDHIVYTDRRVVKVECEIFITILLHLKLVGSLIDLKYGARVLLWCTHPDDPIKLIPTFNIYLRLPVRARNCVSNLLHARFKRRLSRFFRIGVDLGGIIFMDRHTFEAANSFYGGLAEPTIWPLITADPALNKERFCCGATNVLTITYLGRLTDFKVNSLVPLIEQIQSSNVNCVLNIVGDGPLKKSVEDSTLLASSLQVNFLGHVDLRHLDTVLLKADIVIGMGTSALEAAKLGVPTLLVNGSHVPVKAHALRVRWLYEVEPYFVGEIVSAANKWEGHTMSDILSAIKGYEVLKTIGDNCKSHWERFHSPNALMDVFLRGISRDGFVFSHSSSRLLRLDLLSEVTSRIKNRLLR